MSPQYSELAGDTHSRLVALSDGVFAVAMTLLVLDLRAPIADLAHYSDVDLAAGIASLSPNFAAYLLSFIMLGTFWLAQHALVRMAGPADQVFTWSQIGFLLVACLLPFSASVLAEHLDLRLAVGIYWANLLLLGVLLWVSCSYLRRRDQGERPDLTVFRRRILVAQVLYFVAAALCLLNTYVSVAALTIVGLYFVVSPMVERSRAART